MFALLLALCVSDEPEEQVVFYMGDYGSKYYRIPAIVTAPDGSLLTATDKRWNGLSDLPGQIDVVVRRSTDGGVTWDEPVTVATDPDNKGYGDPALVVDRYTGIIMCIFSGSQGFRSSTPTDRIRNFYSLSCDNGATWGEITEFTDQIYGSGCSDSVRQNWYAMFASSGAALCTRDGKIMFVGVVRNETGTTSGYGYVNYAIWTSDLGNTWEVGGAACYFGDEAKVVELNNGSILMSIKNGTSYRIFVLSNDGGKTWGDPVRRTDILDPWCNGDLIRYTSTLDGYNKNRLIHTIPYHATSRVNVSILISYDEGNTWPVQKTICSSGSAYSTAAVLPDGRIAVYYEKGSDNPYELVCAVMTLDWISDDSDTWTAATEK